MTSKKRAKSSRKSRQGKQASRATSAGPAQHLAELPTLLPVLPAKDMVAFPSVMMSLYVGRPASVSAVERAMEADRLIFIVAQRNQETEDPGKADLYRVGVVANVVRTLKLPDGRFKVLLQGIVRAEAERFNGTDPLTAKIRPLEVPERYVLKAEDEVIMNRIRENLQVLVEHEHLPEEMLLVTEELHDPGVLADVVLAHYKLDPAFAQGVLEWVVFL